MSLAILYALSARVAVNDVFGSRWNL